DRPRDLTGACISLIKLDGVVSESIARINAAWPTRLSPSDLLGESMTVLSRDRLLHCLLQSAPITDIGLERLLTNVRRALLTTSAANDARDEDLLYFCCALAGQCFINQYIFSTTEAEAHQAYRLRASLEDVLAAGQPCPALWPAIVGAYFPLHGLKAAEK